MGRTQNKLFWILNERWENWENNTPLGFKLELGRMRRYFSLDFKLELGRTRRYSSLGFKLELGRTRR